MSTASDSGPKKIEWFAEPGRAKALWRGKASSRMRMEERRVNSLGIIIIASLLFVLLAAALTVGGDRVGSLLSSRAARKAMEKGDILVTMPNGVLCRRMSFDNRTGRISGGTIQECPGSVPDSDVQSGAGFRWGGR